MYDVIVLGAGPAGYEVASLLSEGGKRVCVIEKNEEQIGGTCLNEGCIPAKNFLESALFVKKMAHFNACGVNATLNSFEIDKLQESTNSLILTLRSGIEAKLKKAGVETKYGVASFESEHKIKVGNEILEATNIVVATGSKHREFTLLPLADNKIISSKEAFLLPKIPASILIVGAGAIGCEFATFFNSLGSAVELVEYASCVLPLEDEDVAKTLMREMQKQKIKVKTSSEVVGATVEANTVKVQIKSKEQISESEYECVLVATGREPNLADLDGEKIALAFDGRFVATGEYLQSSSHPHIYAIGDVVNSPALAHMAYYEAKRVASHILGQEVMPQNSFVPNVTFCSPQVASVGESEKSLKEAGTEYKIVKNFFKSSGKAKIKGDDSGFVKVLVGDDEKILGASIIGNDATEIIHELQIALSTNLTMPSLAKIIFAHPTLSESIAELTH